nr:uncharacterized protein LOC133610176 [Nerophis lumbriciformis]
MTIQEEYTLLQGFQVDQLLLDAWGTGRIDEEGRDSKAIGEESTGFAKSDRVDARRLERNPRTTQQNPKKPTTRRGRGNSASEVSDVCCGSVGATNCLELWACGLMRCTLAVWFCGQGAIGTQRPAATPRSDQEAEPDGTASCICQQRHCLPTIINKQTYLRCHHEDVGSRPQQCPTADANCQLADKGKNFCVSKDYSLSFRKHTRKKPFKCSHSDRCLFRSDHLALQMKRYILKQR